MASCRSSRRLIVRACGQAASRASPGKEIFFQEILNAALTEIGPAQYTSQFQVARRLGGACKAQPDRHLVQCREVGMAKEKLLLSHRTAIGNA